MNDLVSQPILHQILTKHRGSYLQDQELIRGLSRSPIWRDIILDRLLADRVSYQDVRALTDDPDARERIQNLLTHDDEHIVAAAIAALPVTDPALRRFIQGNLGPDSATIRTAIIHRLKGYPMYWPLLDRFLKAEDDQVRRAAAEALTSDTSLQDTYFSLLHDDRDAQVKHAAITALRSSRIGRAALREYFGLTRSFKEHDFDPRTSKFHMYGYIRAKVVQELANEPDEIDRPLLRGALTDPHPEVRTAAVAVAPRDEAYRTSSLKLLRDQNSQVRHATYRALADDHEVQEHLCGLLAEDDWALRTSAFGALIDYPESREQLRNLLVDPETPSDERWTLLRPLMRDPEARADLLRCIEHDDRAISGTALSLLRHDAELRRRLRERARDPHWLARQLFEERVLDILREDPDARPILLSQFSAAIKAEDGGVLIVLMRLLQDEISIQPQIRVFLSHSNKNFKLAAISALRHDDASRQTLIEMLGDSDNHVRAEAAEALKNEAALRPRYRAMIGDPEKSIREVALDVLQHDDDPKAEEVLLRRLTEEPEAKLRLRLIESLRGRPSTLSALRARLHEDYDSWVRKAATHALAGDVPALHPTLEASRLVARALDLVRNPDGPPLASARLREYLARPTPLDLDADPEFGEQVLSWATLRLAWASEDGGLTSGRILGELWTVTKEFQSAIVIRVAMDVSDLPRERHFRPTWNLTQAWNIARHLHTRRELSIILACADVAFEHIIPPPLQPGQTLWGPTFFGFRLSEASASTADVDGPGANDEARRCATR